MKPPPKKGTELYLGPSGKVTPAKLKSEVGFEGQKSVRKEKEGAMKQHGSQWGVDAPGNKGRSSRNWPGQPWRPHQGASNVFQIGVGSL